MTLTAGFLGAPADWAAARLRLDDVHGLWGGQVLYLSGQGQVLVQRVPPGRVEARFVMAIAPAEAQAVFALCVEQDVLAMAFPPRALIPDEACVRLTLVSAAGRAQSVTKCAHDPHAGFAAVSAALRPIAERAAQAGPVAPGPFDAEFRPAWL